MNEMVLTNQHNLPDQTASPEFLAEYQSYRNACNRQNTLNAIHQNFWIRPSAMCYGFRETPADRVVQEYHNCCNGKLRFGQLTSDMLANLALKLEGDTNCRGFLNERIVHDECRLLFQCCRSAKDWTGLLILWCCWRMNYHTMSFWIGPALLLYLLDAIMELKPEFRNEDWSDLIFDCIHIPNYVFLLWRLREALSRHWLLSVSISQGPNSFCRSPAAFPAWYF